MRVISRTHRVVTENGADILVLSRPAPGGFIEQWHSLNGLPLGALADPTCTIMKFAAGNLVELELIRETDGRLSLRVQEVTPSDAQQAEGNSKQVATDSQGTCGLLNCEPEAMACPIGEFPVCAAGKLHCDPIKKASSGGGCECE